MMNESYAYGAFNNQVASVTPTDGGDNWMGGDGVDAVIENSTQPRTFTSLTYSVRPSFSGTGFADAENRVSRQPVTTREGELSG